MAFDVLDEYEQSEQVRKWLRENFLAIAIGIVLGLLLIFGWQQWRAHKAARSVEAAQQYAALTTADGAGKTDDVEQIAAALRERFPDSVYAALAAMRQADLATTGNDLAGAVADLQWAVDHAGDPALKQLAGLRLARAQLANGDADAALRQIDAVPQDNYRAEAAELRGDALARLSRNDEARKAYEDALSHLDQAAPGRVFVQMKLDNVAATAPTPEAATPAPAGAAAKPGQQGS
jgi:predicted negative regulator of RcsB-dependent stress response